MTADTSLHPSDIQKLKRLVDELRSELDQRRQNEGRLGRAVADTQDAMQAQRSALAYVSHEMRNQLQLIDGAVEQLEKSPLSPDQRESLEQCRSANGLLLALVEDILTGARMEADHFTLECTSFSPAELVRNISKLLSATAGRKGLHLDCRIEPDIPDLLLGDPRRIRQILFNLAGNAIKFTHKGTVTLRVAMIEESQAADPPTVCFSVEDTGVGIPGSKIEEIFEPFARITSADNPLEEGAGLGLSITRKLIDLMGGNLTVESCEGKGSCFSFTVRLAKADTLPSPAPSPTDKPSSFRPGLRILLAEDAPDIRLLFAAFLASGGHSVETAENGEEAVQKFREGGFDLVLMDMQMPLMDGYQATRLIREWEHSQGAHPVPVLALTASTERSDLLRSRESGCSERLSKPVKKDTLLRAIAAHAKI